MKLAPHSPSEAARGDRKPGHQLLARPLCRSSQGRKPYTTMRGGSKKSEAVKTKHENPQSGQKPSTRISLTSATNFEFSPFSVRTTGAHRHLQTVQGLRERPRRPICRHQQRFLAVSHGDHSPSNPVGSKNTAQGGGLILQGRPICAQCPTVKTSHQKI